MSYQHISISKNYTTEIKRCGNYMGWVLVSERRAREAGLRLGLAPNSHAKERTCLSCVQSPGSRTCKYHLPAREESPVPTKILTALHWNISMYSSFNPFVTEYFMTSHCHGGRIYKAPFSMPVQDNLIANIILYLCVVFIGKWEHQAPGAGEAVRLSRCADGQPDPSGGNGSGRPARPSCARLHFSHIQWW